MDPNERVYVGGVVRAFGIQGEVMVAPSGDDPGRWKRGTAFIAVPSGEPRTERTLEIERLRVHHDAYLVKFREVLDRDDAEALRGAALYQRAVDLPALPQGTYYHYQLIGLTVRSAKRVLGTVSRILEAGGDDLYEVSGPEGTWLIPGRKEFIRQIDLQAGVMELEPREDLLGAQARGAEDAPPARRRRT